MVDLYTNELMNYTKAFSGLTIEDEVCLKEVSPVIIPHLEKVTDSFYEQLMAIPQSAEFLTTKINFLKQTHLQWLILLFTHDIDSQFVRMMYKIGDVHAHIKLPIEFMVGSMTLLNNELLKTIFSLLINEPDKCLKTLKAINSITGFSLNLMLLSFYTTTFSNTDN